MPSLSKDVIGGPGFPVSLVMSPSRDRRPVGRSRVSGDDVRPPGRDVRSPPPQVPRPPPNSRRAIHRPPGVADAPIARRLGHAPSIFTQDRYGHLFEQAGSQAAAAAAMVHGPSVVGVGTRPAGAVAQIVVVRRATRTLHDSGGGRSPSPSSHGHGGDPHRQPDAGANLTSRLTGR